MSCSHSRYDAMERRDEPTRAFGRQSAKQPGRQRNPYPYGTRKYWLWQEGYNAERQAQRRADAEMADKPRRRPVPDTRRPAGVRPQSLAQLAGTLCSNPTFQAWCGASDSDEAAAWVRSACGITSRRELDTNPAAARVFHDRIRRPFAASRDK